LLWLHVSGPQSTVAACDSLLTDPRLAIPAGGSMPIGRAAPLCKCGTALPGVPNQTSTCPPKVAVMPAPPEE